MKLLFVKYSLPLIVALIVAFTSAHLIMLNTGDYYRSIFPFIDKIPQFTKDIPFSFPLKESFNSISHYEYKSSYSVLLYMYALVISFFTNSFNIEIYSSLLKILYIIILAILFYRVQKIESKVALLAAYFLSLMQLISSSNLAFFGSFYQEQVLLICLPILLAFIGKNNTKGYILTFLSIVIIACSKSQFFYIPLIFLCYYIIYDRTNLKIKTVLTALSLALSLFCMFKTTSTVAYNKYHSVYFGIYEYERINGIDLPESADKNCVGIDSWGNRFDLKLGVISTSIGETCFDKHKDTNFKEAIGEIVKHPSILLKLPFDDGVKTQLTENYFHVYKAMPLIINNDGFYASITHAKDALYKNMRFIFLVIAFVFSLVLRKDNISGLIFVCSTLGISQFYISFIGEGYRDMDKHLFGMNFSFDMTIFLITISLFSFFKKDK